jgi:hypothetical protein
VSSLRPPMRDTTGNTTSPVDASDRLDPPAAATSAPAVVLCLYPREPHREGQIVQCDPRGRDALLVGRLGKPPFMQRPGENTGHDRLHGDTISGEQMFISAEGDGARVHNVGQRRVLIDGTVGVRNAARTALKSAIKAEVATIQAAADADPDNAEAIITSTSLTVRKVGVRVKALFAVTQGPVSGTAILVVKSAGYHASYDWQMSVDGGKTWTEIPSTTRTKTSVPALPVGTTVIFRFRSLTPKGQSDWSQPIGLLVK